MKILNDMENLELKLKWLFAIESLSAESREALYKQMHSVVVENNLAPKSSNLKLDMHTLVAKIRLLLDEENAEIEDLEDFINRFCSNTKDISYFLEKLGQLAADSYR